MVSGPPKKLRAAAGLQGGENKAGKVIRCSGSLRWRRASRGYGAGSRRVEIALLQAALRLMPLTEANLQAAAVVVNARFYAPNIGEIGNGDIQADLPLLNAAVADGPNSESIGCLTNCNRAVLGIQPDI